MTDVRDVVVIGGGVVGLAVARQLSGEGRSVLLLEAAEVGGAASRASAGMLAPRAEAAAPGAFFDLTHAARERFWSFAAELSAETGQDLDCRSDGYLAVPADVEDESDRARKAEWQRALGLPVEELTRAEAEARWPGLALAPRPGSEEARRFGEGRLFFFPDEGQVDSTRLVQALLAACRGRAVEVRQDHPATGIVTAGGRVEAVRTEHERIPCATIVNAAGAWAGQVAAWVGEALPIEPVRGEMLAYSTSQMPPRPIVAGGGVYSVLRADGALLIGATMERAGYAAVTTNEGQGWLEAGARALLPAIAHRAPSARWAGLRPGTADGLPVLGFSTEARGLYHATGHFRAGVLLAPLTADIVADALGAGNGAVALAAEFGPQRFAHAGSAA